MGTFTTVKHFDRVFTLIVLAAFKRRPVCIEHVPKFKKKIRFRGNCITFGSYVLSNRNHAQSYVP